MVLAQLVINLRYSLMSISVSQKADRTMTTPVRFAVGFGITDEIFAVAVGQNKMVGRRYMAGLIITPFIGWALGTFLGAVVGDVLPVMITEALGIAIYAMFLAIIIPPARENKKLFIVIGIAAAISCIRFYTPLQGKISSGFTIIIAAVIASAIGALLFPAQEEAEEETAEESAGEAD